MSPPPPPPPPRSSSLRSRSRRARSRLRLLRRLRSRSLSLLRSLERRRSSLSRLRERRRRSRERERRRSRSLSRSRLRSRRSRSRSRSRSLWGSGEGPGLDEVGRGLRQGSPTHRPAPRTPGPASPLIIAGGVVPARVPDVDVRAASPGAAQAASWGWADTGGQGGRGPRAPASLRPWRSRLPTAGSAEIRRAQRQLDAPSSGSELTSPAGEAPAPDSPSPPVIPSPRHSPDPSN